MRAVDRVLRLTNDPLSTPMPGGDLPPGIVLPEDVGIGKELLGSSRVGIGGPDTRSDLGART